MQQQQHHKKDLDTQALCPASPHNSLHRKTRKRHKEDRVPGDAGHGMYYWPFIAPRETCTCSPACGTAGSWRQHNDTHRLLQHNQGMPPAAPPTSGSWVLCNQWQPGWATWTATPYFTFRLGGQPYQTSNLKPGPPAPCCCATTARTVSRMVWVMFQRTAKPVAENYGGARGAYVGHVPGWSCCVTSTWSPEGCC